MSAASQADGEEAYSEEGGDDENESVDTVMRLMPSYPFPAEFQLEFDGTNIAVIPHLSRRHPQGTRAVAVFFPGVHGGVGPCRLPGQNFDADALYPSVARRLVGDCDADVDCYRCSWPYMRPTLHYAISGAVRVLHHALLEAMKGTDPAATSREISVMLVGHSLGGAVAVHAAEVIAGGFGPDGVGCRHMPGLERAVVRFSGVCTLNGALDVRRNSDENPFAALGSSRALLVSGDADEVVPPQATSDLFQVMPMAQKRHILLPGGTHDLYAHKAQLVDEVANFILEGIAGSQLTGENVD